ncbi:hypothetical protein CXG50_01860 [Pseudomonas plecoglossicida]|uniref:Uncharacterized protein n=2 Tax=Pseudomonas putida group TaxID=136845 RepID=A0ABX4U303_PSEDL|nr:hypothetical protein CX682_03715 [Pseudomonas sp. FFUP_PS_41]PLU89364.1 hypothetical protein CXG44_01750 [Pseudomonas plecoglossicida]RNF92830.1 hypothetical protein EFK07_05305 [Pseudomonas putida]PLU94697.1 hypothetical protein CXG45_06670 [Pseudomonas plecoglossicida]PLV00665.1 hypothetical protein CXG52_03385 [Pseudomonas plecoglossicida]
MPSSLQESALVCWIVEASSRVNPLPQVLCCPQVRRFPCGSGFTREEAHTVGRHCYDGQRFRGVRACRCRR